MCLKELVEHHIVKGMQRFKQIGVRTQNITSRRSQITLSHAVVLAKREATEAITCMVVVSKLTGLVSESSFQ